MAHGKETPRQKMIGMMYLVLTALLALNVSREVLDAFVIVDEGLTKTTENFALKNQSMYSAFEQAAAENSAKAGKWLEKANEVKTRANELVNAIHDYKLLIVKTSEGGETPAIVNGEIEGKLIGSKDDTNIPAQLMIVEGRGKELKAKISDFRNFLLGMIDPKASGIRSAIEKSLDTENPKTSGGKTETWESEHFEHLPLVGVLTIMSNLQGNIRNSETETLNFLYGQIDAGAFKFNRLEATVIHNSNYIIRGNEYNAEVFIAAFDTTQRPSVLVGNYQTIENPDGTIDYKMTGSYDSLPVVQGKGVYKIRGSSLGMKKWGGLVVLKAPDGGADIKKPFSMSYQVAEPSLVVSPTKMNVFYLGVDNPVDISVSGVPSDKIFPSITNGRIRQVGKSYIVNPTRPGNSQISVIADIDGKRQSMGSMEFRVKVVPNPVPTVGGLKGGDIGKTTLMAQNGVKAEMDNFDFDLSFRVTEFVVSTSIGGFVRDLPSKSNKFTPEQSQLMQNMGRNQRVYIQDIKAVGPDGTIRDLPTIAFRVI